MLLPILVFTSAKASLADDEFYGIIQKRPQGKTGIWIIGGRQIVVKQSTELKTDEGPLVVGACVEVDYDDDRVSKIETEEQYKCR